MELQNWLKLVIDKVSNLTELEMLMTPFVLHKELIIRSQQQDTSKDGISLITFSVNSLFGFSFFLSCYIVLLFSDSIVINFFKQKYVCHGCVFLGQALFKDFCKHGKSSKKTSTTKPGLSKDQFVTGSQKIVQLIGDEQLLTYYVQVSLTLFSYQSRDNHVFQIFNRYLLVKRIC